MDEIEKALRDGILSGDLEDAGIIDGERKYRLTKQGEARAEALFRDRGVDPHDKEAVEQFLFNGKPPKLKGQP